MKTFYTIFFALTISTFYSFGDEDEVTMNENLVYTVFDITNGNNIDFNLYTMGGTESFTANSNNYSFTTNTFSAAVISGTSFLYPFQISFDYLNNSGCIDVNARTYHNGSLHESRNYTIGYTNFPADICPDGISIYETYGIIAD